MIVFDYINRTSFFYYEYVISNDERTTLTGYNVVICWDNTKPENKNGAISVFEVVSVCVFLRY